MLRGTHTALALLLCATLSAQVTEHAIIEADTVAYTYTPIDQAADAQMGNQGFGLRLNRYLTLSADDPRRVKFSVVGAPAYSENTGWRLSAVATMHYRTPRVTTPHSLSLRAMASLKGCYTLMLDGVNHLDDGRHKFTYGGSFGFEPTYIYGLDFATSMENRRGEYTSQRFSGYFSYNYQLTSSLVIGISANYLHDDIRRMDERAEAIIGTLESRYSGAGVGVNLSYSTRHTEDINTTRGLYLHIAYMMRPKMLGTYGHTLHTASITFDYYQPLWRGGLLALDIYGEHHSDNTPWMLRGELGGENRMRGYYRGRFNGNSLAAVQLELRQRVWEGLVVAGWGGCGTALSKGDIAAWSKLLPTYGVGLRWYFSPTSLVRVDYGMGKGCSAFVVGYTEAF